MSKRKGKPIRCEKCDYEISSFFFKCHFEKCDGIGPKWATQSKRAKNPGVKFSPGGWNKGLTRDDERINRGAKAVRAAFLKKLLLANFDSLSINAKKKRLIIENAGRCNICGLDKWLELPIPLHLDHIDGDNRNNVRENLRTICPNCHAQTPTYCGRDRSFNRRTGRKYEVSEVDIIEAVKTSKNLAGVIRKLGTGNSNYRYYSALCKEIMVRENLIFAPFV